MAGNVTECPEFDPWGEKQPTTYLERHNLVTSTF